MPSATPAFGCVGAVTAGSFDAARRASVRVAGCCRLPGRAVAAIVAVARATSTLALAAATLTTAASAILVEARSGIVDTDAFACGVLLALSRL
eukprot:6004747-Prymnesium_polylepis.1